MADQREGGIDWTDKTWNFVRGCDRVSPGCGGARGVGGCYAEKMAARFCGPDQAYEGLVKITPQGARWTGVTRFVPEHLADPLRWRKPLRIFVNSMSDLFHDGFTNEEIAAGFGVMAAAPHHSFQILTKRPARMRAWFEWVDQLWPSDPYTGILRFAQNHIPDEMERAIERCGLSQGLPEFEPWPLPNCWLGVTAEDQQRADERIPLLLQTTAAKRFVSVEPQLGHVDLGNYVAPLFGDRIDWVIQGCESGHGARPFDIGWALSMRDQCVAAGVAYFLKQTPVPGEVCATRGIDKQPELQGRTWKEFPRG